MAYDASLPPYASTSSTSTSHTFVPLYSEVPSTSERVLIQRQSDDVPLGTRTVRDHVYCSEHLELNLGPATWGTRLPVYGHNGVVEGTVKFRKNCSHVVRITAKLQGNITTNASEHARAAIVSRTCLLPCSFTTLYCAETGPLAPDAVFPLSLPFPSYINGCNTPLPPTFSAYSAGILCNVAYNIRIDIVRKGLHRHETCHIPVYYLPKTRPSSPPVEEIPPPLSDPTLSNNVKMVALTPVWLTGASARAPASGELPSVTLSLPLPLRFASGDEIPLTLSINSPHTPVLSKLLVGGVTLQLLSRRKIWFNGGRSISVREVIISEGYLYNIDDFQEGMSHLSMKLKMGEAGRLSSFCVDGALEVGYFIRVKVAPPSNHENCIPLFKHEQPIEVTTDRWESRERDLLLAMDGGILTPALGMT